MLLWRSVGKNCPSILANNIFLTDLVFCFLTGILYQNLLLCNSARSWALISFFPLVSEFFKILKTFQTVRRKYIQQFILKESSLKRDPTHIHIFIHSHIMQNTYIDSIPVVPVIWLGFKWCNFRCCWAGRWFSSYTWCSAPATHLLKGGYWAEA